MYNNSGGNSHNIEVSAQDILCGLCPKTERTQNLTARLKQHLLVYYFHSPIEV